MALTTDSFPLAFPQDAGFDLRVEAQVSPDSDRIPVTVTVLTGSEDSKLGRIELSLYESLYSAVTGHESEHLYSLWDSMSEADAIDDGQFDRSVLIIKRIALHPTSEPTLRAEVVKAAVDFLGPLVKVALVQELPTNTEVPFGEAGFLQLTGTTDVWFRERFSSPVTSHP